MRRRSAYCIAVLGMWLCYTTSHADTHTDASHVLVRTPQFVARRSGLALVVDLQTPHRVLSTSTEYGGMRHKLRHIVNMQSMEGRSHDTRIQERLSAGSAHYHRQSVLPLHLPPDKTALMGTAAHLGHLGHTSKSFQNLRVDAFATAGVHGNAVAAGDPARYYQSLDGSGTKPAELPPGTINIIVLINHPLKAGAMVKAVTVAVEAKSAALQALAVPSRQSNRLATGTGTDQVSLAAPLTGSGPALESASQHLKLGELIGAAVQAAVSDALQKQNGLSPDRTRSLPHALGRYGFDDEKLRAGAASYLGGEVLQNLQDNVLAVIHEPRVASAAFAYATVLDRVQYGTISGTAVGEALRDQAALLAVAVAQRPLLYGQFWLELGSTFDGWDAAKSSEDLSPIIHAVALGFAQKWATSPAARGTAKPTKAGKR